MFDNFSKKIVVRFTSKLSINKVRSTLSQLTWCHVTQNCSPKTLNVQNQIVLKVERERLKSDFINERENQIM